MLFPCVVHQNVDAPERIYNLGNGFFARFQIADIARNCYGHSALLFDNRNCFCRIVILTQVKHSNVRTFASLQGSNRTANTAIGTGDDGYLAASLPELG